MGYSTDRNGIKRFWPDDDEKTIYLSGEYSLGELVLVAQEKWPDASMDDIEISTDYIHTHCLGYNRYDPGDYTCFIVLTLEAE